VKYLCVITFEEQLSGLTLLLFSLFVSFVNTGSVLCRFDGVPPEANSKVKSEQQYLAFAPTKNSLSFSLSLSLFLSIYQSISRLHLCFYLPTRTNLIERL